MLEMMMIIVGSFPEDSRHPFAGSTTAVSGIALALYSAMWGYDGWYVLTSMYAFVVGVSDPSCGRMFRYSLLHTVH